MIIKVSHKWVTKIIDCTLNGILNGCHGRCCKTLSFYPAKSNNGICYWLGDNGCKLSLQDKPIKCLLYPLIINECFTLELHIRAQSAICKECYGVGNKTIIENQRDNLEVLFGKDIIDRMIIATVKEHRDFSFRTNLLFDKEYLYECKLEENNIIPVKRSMLLFEI